MKKTSRKTGPSKASLREMPEVDFSKLQRGRRGQYAHLLTGDAVHAVVIDADLWAHFKSGKAINSALRRLINSSKKNTARVASRKGGHKAA